MNKSVTIEEYELKLIPSNVYQRILTSIRGKGNSKDEINEVFRIVKSVLNLAEFNISQDRIESIIDEFFDTEDFKIYRAHATLCVRSSKGRIEITTKKVRDLGQNIFSQQETSKTLSREEYSELIKYGLRDTVEREFPNLHGQRCLLVLQVDIERRYFALHRRGEEFVLVLDLFDFIDPRTGKSTETQVEVEIEAQNILAKSNLGNLRHILVNDHKDFNYPMGSKYERGIEQFELVKVKKIQAI